MKKRILILVLFVSFLFAGVKPVSAQDQGPVSKYNPTTCVFQPPEVDRGASLAGGMQMVGKTISVGTNYSWDETYPGLHRVNLAGWPGVDYFVPTTLPFKNGGTVDSLRFDTPSDGGSTGGYSLYVRGEGLCEGWYVYIGHLAYDPTTRYKVGQHIGPDEVVGEPGCSGFEDNCWTGDPENMPKNQGLHYKHNHYALGYKKNVFNFGDGTKIAYQAGYYWINVARMEDTALNENILYNIPKSLGPGEVPVLDPHTGWSVQKDILYTFNVNSAKVDLPPVSKPIGIGIAAVIFLAAILVPSLRRVILILLILLLIAGIIVFVVPL